MYTTITFVGLAAFFAGPLVALYLLSMTYAWEGTGNDKEHGMTRFKHVVLAPLTLWRWYKADRRKNRTSA